MGGISGRQGRFSGLVTEGMSSMGPMMGLAGPRWAWAPAILALVGLVGLALWREATGKGPACPGLECCTEKERGRRDQGKENHRKEGRKDNDRKEKRREERRDNRNNDAGHSEFYQKIISGKNNMVAWSCIWVTHAAQDTNNKVGKRFQTPDCSKKRNLWWLISDSIDI